MNKVFSKLDVSRINYWKHLLALMAMFLILFGSIIFSATLSLPAIFSSILYSFVVVVPIYYLLILIGRLRNIGGRSFILWFLGVLTPFLGIVMIVRLGLIKAEDESDFSWKQRLFVAVAATIYVVFYFTLILARVVMDYPDSQA